MTDDEFSREKRLHNEHYCENYETKEREREKTSKHPIHRVMHKTKSSGLRTYIVSHFQITEEPLNGVGVFEIWRVGALKSRDETGRQEVKLTKSDDDRTIIARLPFDTSVRAFDLQLKWALSWAGLSSVPVQKGRVSSRVETGVVNSPFS